MISIGEFFWAALAGGGLSAGLMAIAAFLCKSQLAHWLNKDIERIKAQHQQELADKQASYQRDLEAYRTSLIAQAEAIKASQDVKKAMAVRIAEMKFEVIKELQDTCAQIGILLLYAQAVRNMRKHVDYRDMAANGGRLHASVIKAKPFIRTEELSIFFQFINDYSESLNRVGSLLSQGLSIDADADVVLERLIANHQTFEQVVFQHIEEMLSMCQ